jgi:hypothetical protein
MAEAVSSWQPAGEKSYVGMDSMEHVCWNVLPAVRVSSKIVIRRRMEMREEKGAEKMRWRNPGKILQKPRTFSFLLKLYYKLRKQQ